MNDATMTEALENLAASTTGADLPSCNFPVGPSDHRCKYWCKIVRAGAALPAPEFVDGASDIPGSYLRKGDVEVFAGDVIFEGEENHHRKQRGWTWTMYAVDDTGTLREIPYAQAKDILRIMGGGAKHLLKGAGACAAMVRAAWYLRLAETFEDRREASRNIAAALCGEGVPA